MTIPSLSIHRVWNKGQEENYFPSRLCSLVKDCVQHLYPVSCSIIDTVGQRNFNKCLRNLGDVSAKLHLFDQKYNLKLLF